MHQVFKKKTSIRKGNIKQKVQKIDRTIFFGKIISKQDPVEYQRKLREDN